jgi:hypothetical protein
MIRKKTATKPSTVVANDPDDRKGRLKSIGGSQSDHWNNIVANQAAQALWLKNSGPEEQDRQLSATVAALIGIGPKERERVGHVSPTTLARLMDQWLSERLGSLSLSRTGRVPAVMSPPKRSFARLRTAAPSFLHPPRIPSAAPRVRVNGCSSRTGG